MRSLSMTVTWVVTSAIVSCRDRFQAAGCSLPPRRVAAFGRTLAVVFLGSGLLFFVQICFPQICFAQDTSENAQQAAPAPPRLIADQAQTEAPSFTFKAITRMVIVEVVVRDREDNPVRREHSKDGVAYEFTAPRAGFSGRGQSGCRSARHSRVVLPGTADGGGAGAAGEASETRLAVIRYQRLPESGRFICAEEEVAAAGTMSAHWVAFATVTWLSADAE